MTTIIQTEVVFSQSDNPINIQTARAVIISPEHWMLVGWNNSADPSFGGDPELWWQLCKRDDISGHHLTDLVNQAMEDHHIEIITVNDCHLPTLIKVFRELKITQIFAEITK